MLFEAIDEGFCIIEKVDTPTGAPSDFRYIAVNPAFAEQTGVRHVLGKTIREAFPEEQEAWFDTYDAIVKTGEAQRFERGLASQGRVLALYAFRIDDPAEGRVAVIFADITERKRAEEQQLLLMGELSHRVKNTLATVQSIVSQTLENEPDPGAFRKSFQKRLDALSRNHNLLAQNEWAGSPLREVLLAQVAPYVDGDAARFESEGPDIVLSRAASLAFGMAFHELSTNAAKYGAFSAPGGQLHVTWEIDGGNAQPCLRLEWRESGGPPVVPPTRRGLGSRLIQRGLPFELGGKAELRFDPGGVRYVFEAPLSRMAEA